MVALKDIAARCGVSVATVSKALNQQQDISEETRAGIGRVAREMGYTVNSAARTLKTNRTDNIGLIFEDLQSSGFMHEYFAATLNSFRSEAARCGYDITFINSDFGHRNTSYLQHARFRQVDGVALICTDYHDPMVQELVFSDIPTITLDHAFNNRTAVLSDNMNGLASLVKYVYSRGHRRIAYIHGGSTAVTESRLTGFYRACEELNLRVPKEYILSCEYHEPISCYAATKRVLTLPVRPTCVLFSDDYSYIGGLNAITDAGLRVPDDISVVGYDGIHLAKMLSPRLTTWQQNTEDLGRLAASRLIEKIEHPLTTPPEHIVVKGRLLEGETVADLNAAADAQENNAT